MSIFGAAMNFHISVLVGTIPRFVIYADVLICSPPCEIVPISFWVQKEPNSWFELNSAAVKNAWGSQAQIFRKGSAIFYYNAQPVPDGWSGDFKLYFIVE